MRSRGLGLISLALLLSAAPALAGTLTVAASDAAGIRDSGDDGTPDAVLTFMAVKDITEDRTVLHFPLAGVPSAVLSATLVVPLDNFDVGVPLGEISVFVFAGDGVVSLDEYGAGSLFAVFQADPSGTYLVDVSAALAAALLAGDTYLSFRLSTVDLDRWLFGSIVGLPDPTLRIVAEPGGLALAAAGLALAARRRRALGR